MKTKEICTVLLVLGIIATMGFSMFTPVYADSFHEAPLSALNEDEVIAEYYYSSDMFSKYLTSCPNYPYHQYIKEMEDDDDFQRGYETWKAANFVENTDSGDEIVSDDTISKEYYEMVLYDLIFGSDSTNYSDCIDSVFKSSQVAAYTSLRKAAKEEFGEDYSFSADNALSEDEVRRLQNSLFEEEGTIYVDVFGTIDNFRAICQGVSTIESLVNRISTVLSFTYLKEEYKLLLNKMSSECDDITLQYALNDIKGYFDRNFSVSYIITKQIYGLAIDRMLDEMHKAIFSDIVSGFDFKWNWPKVVYKTGRLLLNEWLSTDQYYETYAKMAALERIEALLDNVTISSRAEYKNAPTTESAKLLNACVDMHIRVMSLGYDFSIDYYKVLDDSGINSVFKFLGYAGVDHSDVIEDFAEKKQKAEHEYALSQDVLKELVAQELDDYPEVYGGWYTIESADEFDTINEISREINRRDPTRYSKLNIKYDGNITINEDCKTGALKVNNIAVNGASLTVARNLYVSGLSFSSGRIIVNKNATVRYIEKMTSEDDLLRVEGDFTVGCNYDCCNMTAGKVELLGNATFSNRDPHWADGGSYPIYGYRPNGTCTTVFCGTKLQTVSGFYDCDTKHLGLGLIDIQNPKFTMEMEGDHDCYPDMTLVSDVIIEEGGNIECSSLNLNGHTINTVGKIVSTDKITVKSDASIKADKGISGEVISASNCELNLIGDVDALSLCADNGVINVEGNTELRYNLYSQKSIIRIKGNLKMYSELVSGSKAPGIIELFGADNNFSGFDTNSTYKTLVMCGNGNQSVSISGSEYPFIVNTHKAESEFTYNYIDESKYKWDPNYKEGNIYLDFCDIAFDKPSYYFEWREIEPKLELNFAGEIIPASKYELAYSDNIEPGTAKINIKCRDNLIGEKDLSFTINKIPMSMVTVEPIPDERIRSDEIGEERRVPTFVTYYYGDSAYYLDSEDYSESYSNNKRPGTATITLWGKGYFTGSRTVKFTIVEYEPVYHRIEVENGETALEQAEEDCAVAISAVAPHAGMRFVKWEVISGDGEIDNEDAENANVTIHMQDTVVRALFELVGTGEGLPHNYGEWITEKESDCRHDGLRKRECKDCGYSITETIPAGHRWNDNVTVDREPTCTETGIQSIHCAACDAQKEEQIIPAKGHRFSEWKELEASTCDNDGLRQRTCENCGIIESEELNALGHDWEETPTIDVEPTCEDNGSQSTHCKRCNAVKESKVIQAKGHAYSDWAIEKDATCMQTGLKKKRCANCGDEITQEIPVVNHIWNSHLTIDKPATCQEEGSESIHCSVCDAVQEGSAQAIARMDDHKYGAWKTTIPATEIAEGRKVHSCNVCGHQEEQTIAMLAPTLPDIKIIKPKAVKKAVTVKWKKLSKKNKKNVSKIQIQISKDRSFRTVDKQKYASAKKTSLKVKGLKKKKTYYVRIRSFKVINGKVHVSKWSSVKKFRMK